MLDQQINQAFMEAYKAKDEFAVSILRMIKSSIMNKKIDKLMPKEEALADEEVLAVLKSEVKKRLESVTSYTQGGRSDLAETEQKEAEFIKKFLPEEMTEEAVREIAVAVITEVGNPGMSGFGKIMGAVMAKTKGAADGTVVSKVVKEELAK